ncbi:MAG: hypothetical protein LBU73_05025 [Helicobacteraceae bacterium]|jgi:Flp pilus assembly protein TadD|nr:hypothetical protein [Helicobacteraceae bacterium]
MRILTAIFLLVFVNCAVVFAETADEAMKRGEKAAESGKHQEAIAAFDIAIEKFSEAIEKNPRDAKAYTDRGQAFQNKARMFLIKNDSAKEEEFRKLSNMDCATAIEIDPNYATAYALRSFNSAISAERYYENAIKDAKRACVLGKCDLAKFIKARLKKLDDEL